MKRAPLAAALLALAAVPAPAAPAPQGDPASETEHTVQPGETLGGIAARAEVPRVLIIEANGLKPPYLIRAGQKLVIPRRRSHTVKPGETAFSIAMAYGLPWADIAAASGLDAKARPRAGQVLVIPTLSAARPQAKASLAPAPPPATGAKAETQAPAAGQPPDTPAPRFVWPLKGPVRRAFAPRPAAGFHDGIDVTAKSGEPVRSAAAGKVIFAGEGPKEYGLTVIVYHGGRWTTTYSFLGRITVRPGDKVGKGERIGLAGTTGLARGPELHFELRRNRIALDPLAYLPAAAQAR